MKIEERYVAQKNGGEEVLELSSVKKTEVHSYWPIFVFKEYGRSVDYMIGLWGVSYKIITSRSKERDFGEIKFYKQDIYLIGFSFKKFFSSVWYNFISIN